MNAGYISVPHSTVTAELVDVCPVRKSPAIVCFRCREHGRRLFDFYSLPDPSITRDFFVVRNTVQIVCTRCKMQQARLITVMRGFREGESGRWLCKECGRFLAEVDAIRGRVTVHSRCCGNQSVGVPEALEAVRLYAATHIHLPDDEADLDDMPF